MKTSTTPPGISAQNPTENAEATTYQLYVVNGRPEGCALDDWFAADVELLVSGVKYAG